MSEQHNTESHAHKTDELNLAHIFEEYWVFMMFGSFFLMTLLMPLLFLGDIKWLLGIGGTIFGVIILVLVLPIISKKCG